MDIVELDESVQRLDALAVRAETVTHGSGEELDILDRLVNDPTWNLLFHGSLRATSTQLTGRSIGATQELTSSATRAAKRESRPGHRVRYQTAVDRYKELADLNAALGRLLLGARSRLSNHTEAIQTSAGDSCSGLTRWQERRAKEFLQANLTENPSIADAAKECGLSASHFTKAFKRATGETPHRWRLSLRAARAKEMLLDGSLTIAQIAAECGFADQSHLTRAFSRLSGTTPGLWRRQCRKERNGGGESHRRRADKSIKRTPS